jgi:hypothetical protein
LIAFVFAPFDVTSRAKGFMDTPAAGRSVRKRAIPPAAERRP